MAMARRCGPVLLLILLMVPALAWAAGPAEGPPRPSPAETNPSPEVGKGAEEAPAPKPDSAGPPPAPASGVGTIRGRNVWDTFQRGGLLMYPILLCSILGMAFAIERFIALRRNAVAPEGLAERVLAAVGEHGVAAGLALCTERPSALGRVLAAGLEMAHGSRDEMTTAMEETGERELWHLERLAKPLNVITGVAPLLGLLGTVQGMIIAFDVVAAKGALGDPRELAEGIATALLTTFAGLCVAIPCLVLYQYFRGRSDRLIVEIEGTGSHLVAQLQKATSHAHPSPAGGGGRRHPDDAAD
jgi:biopolymer transport protein ExbB